MTAEETIVIGYAGGYCEAVITRNESGTAVVDLLDSKLDENENVSIDYDNPQRVPILFLTALDAMKWIAENHLGW